MAAATPPGNCNCRHPFPHDRVVFLSDRDGLIHCVVAYSLPRNICGNGSMFGIFELLKSHVDERWRPVGVYKGAAYVSCSIIAGASSWLIVFPLDVIKTNIVTVTSPISRPTFRAVALDLWSKGGIPGLYRGLGPTMLRSVPVNAVYLPTFVLINDTLSDVNMYELRTFAAGHFHK